MFSKKYIDGLINHLGAKVLFIERDLDLNLLIIMLLKDLKMFQPKLLENADKWQSSTRLALCSHRLFLKKS